MWIALALLCAAGFLLIARRKSETRSSDQLRDAGFRAGGEEEPGSLEDSIDWDELRKAEDEIRDVDPMAKPEDGFEGDDWGPGSARRPPVA
ncbi:MAG TPA: hypothetical protein VMF70_11580 [Gemmatimonadales bacterium]|nr:hypothetical protein [Gemmatimonadales bacterium]